MIVIGFVVVLIQIIDLSAGDTWAVNINDRVSLEHLILYFVIIVASIIIQALLLINSIRLSISIRKPTTNFAVVVAYIYAASQILVIILLTYLLYEQAVSLRYPTLLPAAIVGISLIISTGIMLSLSYTCLKSYFLRKSKMVGVYGLAIIALSVQLTSAFFYVEINLSSKPSIITPDRNPWASYEYSSLNAKLSSIYSTSKIVSFIAVWGASVILTKSNIQRIGRMKYVIIVSIPIAYFLLQYSPLLLEHIGTLGIILMTKGSIFPYIYNFVLNTVNVGSGILFGISFFVLSKGISYDQLKYYLIICGTGIMIIFSSNVSTILTLSTFPAWAIASISFVLPASFLILIGLDSATFYIAGDIKVRKFLIRFRNQFDMLAALGSAEASAATERKIHNLSTRIYEDLENENLFTARAEHEDIKEYIKTVMAELKKSDRKDNP